MNIRMPQVPSSKSGVRFIACKRCSDERPPDVAPEDFAKLSVALTAIGIQVWCVRHDLNVAHFDVDGRPIRVNTGISGTGFQTIVLANMPPCDQCARGVAHEHN